MVIDLSMDDDIADAANTATPPPPRRMLATWGIPNPFSYNICFMAAAIRVFTETGFLSPISVDLPANLLHYNFAYSAVDPDAGGMKTYRHTALALDDTHLPLDAIGPRYRPCALHVLQQTMQPTPPPHISGDVAALGWESLGFELMRMDDSVAFVQRLLALMSREASLLGVTLPWESYQTCQQGGFLCLRSGRLHHPDPVLSLVTELCVPPRDDLHYSIADLCNLHFAGEHVEVLHCDSDPTPHTHIHQWDFQPRGPLAAYRVPRFVRDTVTGISTRQTWQLAIDDTVHGLLVDLSDSIMAGHYIAIVRSDDGWCIYDDRACTPCATLSPYFLRRVVLVVCST